MNFDNGYEIFGKIKLYFTASFINSSVVKVKGKSVPLWAWTSREGFQEVKFPRFRDNGTGWW